MKEEGLAVGSSLVGATGMHKRLLKGGLRERKRKLRSKRIV